MQVMCSQLLKWIYCLNCHAKDMFIYGQIIEDEVVRERVFSKRSDLYCLKGKVLQKMITEGYAKPTQPVTLWKHRFVLVKLNNNNMYHLPVITNFPTATDAYGVESTHCWYPKKEKRTVFYEYLLEEVVTNLTAYINDEYEVIKDEKLVKRKKEPKVDTKPTIACTSMKKKRKQRLSDKRSTLHIPIQENFDPREIDILLQSIALIGERTIRKYIKHEQPHRQRLICIGEAVKIMKVLESERAVCQAKRGYYRVGDLVFDCLLYSDMPFGRILIPLAPPVEADDFDEGYCISELEGNQYYGGLGKKTASSYIYAASRYYH